MRALVRRRFGGPEELQVEEVPRPEPGDGDLLVAVDAVSLNLGDWELLTGRPPFITALASIFGRRPSNDPPPYWPRGGVATPKHKILGTDFSGRVEAVGAGVSRFAPGDEVFGMAGFGALAEYLCVGQQGPVALRPASMPTDHAAAIPQPAFIVAKAFRGRRQFEPGSRLLVVGGGGGTGTMAIQLAKASGLAVTGVDNHRKLDLMRRAGADHVLDHEQDDVTRRGQCFDLILDLAAHRSVFDYRPVLEADGAYLMAGGAGAPTAQAAFLGPVVSRFGPDVVFLLANDEASDLEWIAGEYASGAFAPVVDDRRFTLDDAGKAFALVGEGRSLGNVIITVASR